MRDHEKPPLKSPIGNAHRAAVFIGLGLVSVLIGFILTPSFGKIAEGLMVQQTASQLLDFNVFAAVGEECLGAPFVNAGVLLIFVILSYLVTGAEIHGACIAAALMVFGFGFAGKALWNVWPLFFGALLHAAVYRKSVRKVIPLAWFSTTLSPLVSVMTFYIRGETTNATIGEEAVFSLPGLAFGILLGLGAGFLVATLSGVLPEKHDGLTLYNVGFAAGLAGFLIFSVMKAIGLGHESSGPFHDYPDLGGWKLALSALACLAYLIVCGVLIARKEGTDIRSIVTEKFSGSAPEQYGFGPTLVNMGVCGLVGLIYWKLTITGTMHGVVLAALFTVVGFAAHGITVPTMLPILAGIWGTSLCLAGIRGFVTGAPILETAMGYVGGKAMIIAALFGCGMAPVVYEHGPLVGFLAGAIHSVLVPNTGALHGWMNLYNNGFCTGIVVTFFVPMLVAWFRQRED